MLGWPIKTYKSTSPSPEWHLSTRSVYIYEWSRTLHPLDHLATLVGIQIKKFNSLNSWYKNYKVQLLYKTLLLYSMNQFNPVPTHILSLFIKDENYTDKYQYFEVFCSWDVSYRQVAHILEIVASRVRSQTLGGGPQSKCPPSRQWNQPQSALHSSMARYRVAAPSRNASMPCHLVTGAGTGTLHSSTSVGRIMIIRSIKPSHVRHVDCFGRSGEQDLENRTMCKTCK